MVIHSDLDPLNLDPTDVVLGFTGSQTIHDFEVAHIQLSLTDLDSRLRPAVVVTGGCIGIDAYVHHWYAANRPDVKRVVTLPGNKAKVDLTVTETADLVFDSHEAYRARNEHIVALSTVMSAFWTGKKAYSGTYMTMNIAKRAGKLAAANLFGIRSLSDFEARKRYFPGMSLDSDGTV